jgi:hypothetical protein
MNDTKMTKPAPTVRWARGVLVSAMCVATITTQIAVACEKKDGTIAAAPAAPAASAALAPVRVIAPITTTPATITLAETSNELKTRIVVAVVLFTFGVSGFLALAFALFWPARSRPGPQ